MYCTWITLPQQQVFPRCRRLLRKPSTASITSPTMYPRPCQELVSEVSLCLYSHWPAPRSQPGIGVPSPSRCIKFTGPHDASCCLPLPLPSTHKISSLRSATTRDCSPMLEGDGSSSKLVAGSSFAANQRFDPPPRL